MALPTTLSQLFQDLSELPPINLVEGVNGTPVTHPSQTDIRLAQAHPETALRAIAAFDAQEQLQQYFNTNCALAEVGDNAANLARYGHQMFLIKMKLGLGSEADIRMALTPLLESLIIASNSVIDSRYSLALLNHNSAPPAPDLVVVAIESATSIQTRLLTIELEFGRPSSETKSTLLGHLSTLLNESPHIVFPEYSVAFPSAQLPPRLDLPAVTSARTVDGRLLPLQLPTLPRPTKHQINQALWSVIHQLWSHMVASDLTFSVITDYHQTYVAIRVRSSQTLYFSDPIDPTNSTSLLSSCTSLFHLALSDAIERQANQAMLRTLATTVLQDHPGASDMGSKRPPDPDDNNQRTKPQARSATRLVLITSSSASSAPSSPSDGLPLVTRLGQKDQSSDKSRSSDDIRTLVMTNYLLPDNLDLVFRTMLHSSTHATPMRKLYPPKAVLAGPTVHTHHVMMSGTGRSRTATNDPTDQSTDTHVTLMDYDPDVGLDNALVLLEEIAHGGSGRIFRGYLDLRLTSSVGVIAKTGKFEHMERERTIYSRLEQRSVRGVPQLLGFYRPKQGYPQWHFGVLVMSDQGEPVKRRDLSHEECEVFINILDAIHEAGIIHNDIRPENLLRARSAGGKALLAIIDFHLSYFTDNPELQQMEKEDFTRILKELRGD